MTDETAATPEPQGPLSHEEAGELFAKAINGDLAEAKPEAEPQEEGQPETEPEDRLESDDGDVQEVDDPDSEPAEEVELAEPEGEGTALPGTIEEFAEMVDLSKDDLTNMTVNVTQNGKPVQVKLSEAIDGHLRLTDYKQKTSALADDRRAFDEVQKSFTNERQIQVDALAGMYKSLQNGFLGAPPDKAMLDENNDQYDPSSYMAKKEQWTTRARQFRGEQNKIFQLQQHGQQENNAQAAQYVAAEYVKLTELHPGWADTKKFTKVQEQVDKAMRNIGFGDVDMDGLKDSRMFEAAWKVAEYDRIMAGTETKKVPKRIPKFQKPGVRPSKTREQREARSAKVEQLRKTGSLDDAAAAFTASLKREK
jgi:hypothetical protein